MALSLSRLFDSLAGRRRESGSASKRRVRDRRTACSVESLENRALLAVQAALGLDEVLRISLSASGDEAYLRLTTDKYQVFDDAALITPVYEFAIADVASVEVADIASSGASSQTFTFTGGFALPVALTVSGMETTTVDTRINAAVDIASTSLALKAPIVAGAGDVTLAITGAVTQAAGASIAANALTVTSTGAVTLNNQANDVATLSVTAGGNVTFQDKNGFQVATISAGSNDVFLTSSGAITQAPAGPITANNLRVENLGVGNVTLNAAGNSVTSGVAILNGSGSVAFTAFAALPIGFNGEGISAGGIVTLLTNGAVSQTSPLVATALRVVNTSGAVTLADPTNAVTNLSIDNSTRGITFLNSGALTIGGVSGAAVGLQGGSVLITAGSVSQASSAGASKSADRIAADDLTIATSPTGSIALANALNAVATLTISSATSASFTDADDLIIAGITAPGGAVTLTTGSVGTSTGGISQTGLVRAASLTVVNNGSGGAVALDTNTNQITTFSAINALDNVSLKNDKALTIAGIVSGGDVTLTTTNDAITQTGAITGLLLSIDAGTANVTLADAANSVAVLEVINAGSVVYANDTVLDLAGINASSATITHKGDLTQSGVIGLTGALTTVNAAGNGDVTLVNSGNSVASIKITNLAGNVSFENGVAFQVLGVSSKSEIDLVSDGAITQGSAAGNAILGVNLSVVASGNVTLANAANDVDNLFVFVSAPGTALVFGDRDDLNLGIASVGGLTVDSADITAGGDVTQTDVIYATQLTVTSAAGDITLANANAVSTAAFKAVAGDVSYTNTTALVIGVGTLGITSGGAISLTAPGVTQTQAISGNTLVIDNDGSSSAVTLANASNRIGSLSVFNSYGDVSFTNAGGLVVGVAGETHGIDVAGTVTLSTAGAVSQILPITAAALAVINTAGGVTLANAANNVDNLSIQNGSRTVTYVDADGITIGGVAGAMVGLQGGVVTLTAGGAVDQAASNSKVTAVTLDVTAAGGVTLDNTGNSIGTVRVSATGAVQVVDGDAAGLILDGIDTTGTITLDTQGKITQTKALVGTSLDITTGGGGVALTNAANDVNTLTASTNGGALSFIDASAIKLLSITTSGGALAVTAAGSISVEGAQQSNAGNLSLVAGSAVVVKADVTATGAGNVLIQAGGGNVTSVAGATVSSDSDTTITASAGVSLAGDVDAGSTATADVLAITAAGGSITLTGAATAAVAQFAATTGIKATGTVTVTDVLSATNASSGNITITNAANAIVEFGAANQAPGGKVQLLTSGAIKIDAAGLGVSTANGIIQITSSGGGISLAARMTSGTEKMTLTSSGDITQSSSSPITAATLEAVNTSATTGDIGLSTAVNSVDVLIGSNAAAGGMFLFSDADALTLGNIADGISTNEGAISIACRGVMLLANLVDAGTTAAATVTLGAWGGISGVGSVSADRFTAINVAVPSSSTTGDIDVFATVAKFSATNATPGSGNVFLTNFAGVDIVGISTPFSAKITAAGAVTGSGSIAADNLTVSATGAVTLDSAGNNVNSLAIQSTGVGSAITYNDADGVTVGIGGTAIKGIRANNGNVTLTAGGAIALSAEVFAGQSTTENILTKLSASGGISQTNVGGVTSDRLQLVNSTADAISLSSSVNDVKYLVGTNSGNIEYVDANDFETGVSQLTGAAVGTAITSLGEVRLAATGAASVLRVVGGIQAPSLSLRGGPSSATATTVGRVEFVTTTNSDGAAAGTLRSMIGLANANTATIQYNGSSRTAPMMMVFDEGHANYKIGAIELAGALPTVSKPVAFVGTRVNSTDTTLRVGLTWVGLTPTNVVNGLTFGRGSDGSSVTGMAIYGFTTGAGIQFASATNAVTNTFVGVHRSGTAPTAQNLVGIDIAGMFASGNTIGSTIVDKATANVIGNNSSAGILIRDGAAANSVFGNFIGVDAAGNSRANTGDGIRIVGSVGNRIGTSLATDADGLASVSNTICNNGGAGVRILTATAATLAFGNAVENNVVQSNTGDGVVVDSSVNQRIGGTAARQGNRIQSNGNTTGAGIAIRGSKGIQASGNAIVSNPYGLRITNSSAALVTNNAVTGSKQVGALLEAGTTGTRVSANTVSASGVDGIRISQSLGNLVLSNVIDGAPSSGTTKASNGVVIIDAAATALALGNVVAGNTVSNNATGIAIQGGSRHTIGGSQGANVITKNANGITIGDGTLLGTSVGNVIRGNYIGTNSQGEAGFGNTASGIDISGAAGTVVDAGNLIANNLTGVKLTSVSSTTIGSAAVGGGNTVRGNTTGIEIASTKAAWTSGVSIMGNTISASGTTATGIKVTGSTTTYGAPTTFDVAIGLRADSSGAAAGRGNTISLPLGGTGNGVVVDAAQGVTVQGNSIVGGAKPILILNSGNAGAVAPTISSAEYSQTSASTGRLVVTGTFAQTGQGRVAIVNGTATFSQSPPLAVGTTLTVNGVNYRVTGGSGTQWTVSGGPATLMQSGAGRVAATRGQASFSASQTGLLSVGQSIVVAGRSYVIQSLSSDGRRAMLAGDPTFLISSFGIIPSPATGYAFTFFSASAMNQQYFVDVYLNDSYDGGGTGRGMRTFLGRQAVTVSPTGNGSFSIALAVPSSSVPVGRYVTATATTMRAINGASAFSTSEASTAKAAVFRAPGT